MKNAEFFSLTYSCGYIIKFCSFVTLILTKEVRLYKSEISVQRFINSLKIRYKIMLCLAGWNNGLIITYWRRSFAQFNLHPVLLTARS